MKKLLEHLNDSKSTGYRSAHAAHSLRSVAELRGRTNELMQILEAIIPLQYEGVNLHSSVVREVLECRPLAAYMNVLASECPFLT